MALSDTELQDIIDRLSPEDRKLLLSQLGRQVEVDKITNPKVPSYLDESLITCSANILMIAGFYFCKQ